MNELFNIYGVGAVALTMALVQIAKKYIEARWLPLVALILGIGIVSLSTWDIGVKYILTGLVIGGMAISAFDLVKKTILAK